MSDRTPAPELLLLGTTPASLASGVSALLERQWADWPQLAAARAGLKQIAWRTVHYADVALRLQHNPSRMASSEARTDAAAVALRPCFLCAEHQPPEQQTVWFGEYRLQANPYPIFRNHLTISAAEHVPQCIGGELPVMLALSRGLGPEFTVLYNGARCGASAPDHRHFQAVERGLLPIETGCKALKNRFGRRLLTLKRCEAMALDDGMRRMVLLTSDNAYDLSEAFDVLRDALGQHGTYTPAPSIREADPRSAISPAPSIREADPRSAISPAPSTRSVNLQNTTLPAPSTPQAPGPEEPMMNLLLWYEHGVWHLMVFCRSRHRPDAFFEAEDKRVVFSPGAVDMGGVCIFPVARDFERVSPQDLAAMMQQVTLPKERFEQVLEEFEQRLRRRL